MGFNLPREAFRNDAIYHRFGTDYKTNIFGCGFLNKKNQHCREADAVYEHYGAVIVLNGEGVHIDDQGRETQVYPGCMIQRIPDKRQSLFINPTGNWLEFFICISKSLYNSLISMDLLDKEQNVLYPGVSHAIFDKINVFFGSMKNTSQMEINMLIPEALKIILMLHDQHKKNTSSSESRALVNLACTLLTAQPNYNVSVQEVASELGVGYEKFRKIFKNHMGISPGNYIIQKRMDTAKTYLIENTKSIKEIAIDLGFSDAFSFSKQFKQMVGISPREFRTIYWGSN